jgi:hypothetical protein
MRGQCVAILRFNHPDRVQERQQLIHRGRHP